ncbi:MAG: DNA-3-methyladenine glycosylase I [Lachnospiraceae bacterium]|nr:DNA-3-methyladenine glycosylase I [Lachnospiraceae bacterium]
MEEKPRCKWCCDGDINQKYHDEEWGIPVHDDRKQFEFLMMEVMQCGLSWTLMLKKREIFRKCFDNFEFTKVSCYGEEKIQTIMEEPGMIRSERKIKAVIHNAKQFIKIIEEFGTFDEYLWAFSRHKMILYKGHKEGKIPAKNRLSDIISKDLKKRGFKYLGSVTVYAHLQACGMINDHTENCFMYQPLIGRYPVMEKEPEDEA